MEICKLAGEMGSDYGLTISNGKDDFQQFRAVKQFRRGSIFNLYKSTATKLTPISGQQGVTLMACKAYVNSLKK